MGINCVSSIMKYIQYLDLKMGGKYSFSSNSVPVTVVNIL